jgi:hypothetical protein
VVPPDVVEHAVEQHPQPAVVRGGQQGVEVGVVAQPGVDPPVVDGVVAVRAGGEDRAERQPGGTELHHVVQPGGQVPEPVHDRTAGRGGRLGADEAQRVHVPPHRVLHPVRHAATVRGYRSAP